MEKIKGIDISYHQGDVDFQKIAQDGVKFIVLREGYRKKIDGKFIDYVKGCQENNIIIMAYHFIYTDGATPSENAQATFDHIKEAGLDPTKIWIAADLEYDTWTRNGEKCTKEKCTKYTKDFLDKLKDLGCNKLFIYCNQDYYKNYYDWSQLDYPIWLADYNGEPNFPCAMQQYTSKGKVNGIKGNVDMDWLFDASMLKEKEETIEAPKKTSNTLSKGAKGESVKVLQKMLIELNYSCGKSGADGNFGKNTLSAVKEFQKNNNLTVDGIYGEKTKKKLEELYNKKIIDKIAQEVLDRKWGNSTERKERLEAAGYDYAAIQARVNELVAKNTAITIESAQSFNRSIAKTYVTTHLLNMRAGASTNYLIVTKIPKNDKVICYGYHTGNWYYVSYGKYNGFCYKQYLK